MAEDETTTEAPVQPLTRAQAQAAVDEEQANNTALGEKLVALRRADNGKNPQRPAAEQIDAAQAAFDASDAALKAAQKALGVAIRAEQAANRA